MHSPPIQLPNFEPVSVPAGCYMRLIANQQYELKSGKVITGLWEGAMYGNTANRQLYSRKILEAIETTPSKESAGYTLHVTSIGFRIHRDAVRS